jgi:hypothetical protein
MSISNYLIANNKVPLKSVTFKFSPIAILVFRNNSCLKLYSIAYERLSVNLKPLTTLCVELNLKMQHITKNSPQLSINKSSGLGYA